MDLEGKVIIITGAGRGLGATTAEVCAREGAKVVLTDIVEEWGEKAVESITRKGGDAAFMKVDVTDPAQVERMIRFTVDRYGKLDGIVNNAATIVVKKAGDQTPEDWKKVIDVNLNGVFYGCKYAINQFERQNSPGSIVNIGSISAVVGMPEQPGYCAAKGGVLQLTRQIAIDYAKQGIRCNTVGPGSIEGEFVRVYIDGQADPVAAEKRLFGSHPMGRIADPVEVANAIVYFLSDKSTFTTGANLQVDGGYSAQ
jgi:NAD(P)-dependent dehydrogenase (short-subunit alcohol dehydrogenase family)